ncbi:membrane protein [Clostridium novyi A str. BKT29909]|uniref:PDZ domain-containing protein n=1 Tax=Clostridium TaxID=1485 RepID=UPI0004D931BA|nr:MULTISPECIES: PDZ domain-containing protein [Clostridium]KEH90067.1 membrane protein [Clostridium novyi A str. 4540]KEH91219.1 membrane protein [Clostridium novyi A str. BKT29909]KEH94617.1 membrane protein [Clostridium botulinum C/D str. It1]
MNVVISTLKSVAYAMVTSPYVFVLLMFIVVYYNYNKKIVSIQKMIIGEKLNSTLELTVSQIVLGIIGGAVGSIMLSYLGVSFDENTSIELIFFLSILLMFIKPKYICFSYSGAVLGFISILLEMMHKMYGVIIPQLRFLSIDVVALMTLVAVMHFVEGILVMIDGSRGSIPIFTKKNGEIIGGFALKRYWVMPIIIALLVNSNGYSLNEIISIGSWKTFLNPTTPLSIIENVAILLMPFYGVVGYSTVTFTKTKREKSITSGLMIMIYSIVLFIFARLAILNIFFELFVVIFAPVAHEAMMYIQRRSEVKKDPKYISNESGMMILEVAPNSPAYDMGIRSGDILLEVNDKRVFKEDDIVNMIKGASNIAWFKVKRTAGYLEEIRYKNINNSKHLGIVFVPMNVPKEKMVLRVDENKFSEILNKMKSKDK